MIESITSSDEILQGQPDAILVTATRFALLSNKPGRHESLVENRHRGWVAVSNPEGELLYCTPGADRLATFFRSSAKPFQAYPLVETGLHQQMSLQELAVACASHSGSARHQQLALAILQKAGLSEADLQCGPHTPSDPDAQAALRRPGEQPTRLHNNCSGKHAGMLLYCRTHGLDCQRYLEPDHPLQQRIVTILHTWGGLADEIPLGVDGCGAPVFYIPLRTIARLYAHLAQAEAFSPIREAMIAYPEVVGGEGRVDTVLMQASRGKLLAKVGADGVMAVAHTERGLGLAMKMADGSNDMRNLSVATILARLGWLDASALSDPRLTPFLDLRRLNTQGRHVGDYQIHFEPGIG